MTSCTTVTKRDLLPSEEATTTAKRRKVWEGRELSEDQTKQVLIDDKFFKSSIESFKSDPQKVMARNTIVHVGLLPLVTDSDQANKVNHIFLNTIKPEHVKATNQMHSGRCWMFAGLNTIRHLIIRALDLKNFEFSETYLYFFDKIERADWFLQEIIKYRDVPIDTHLVKDNPAKFNDYMERLLEKPIEDGGYWNFFANLVDKYGLVPKQAMDETVNSLFSDEMNTAIKRVLHQAAFLLRDPKCTQEEMERIRQATIKKITDMMIIFMGTPPTKFDWSYTNTSNESFILRNVTPKAFKEIVMPGLNFSEDFVVLGNCAIKEWPFNKVYEVNSDSNMIGGKTHRFLNLPIEELKKHAMKSIQKGMPVWFTGDVSKGFHPIKSALDEKLFNFELAFGKPLAKLDKGQRLLYKESQACHAMTMLGVNLDEKGRPVNWQVENSWGYYDDEEPGEDGFLTMSDEWFTENVFEVVVHKTLLSRTVSKLLDKEPIQLRTMGSAAHP